ncbi:OmpA family protein [Chitinophagaceae bacterium LWZ2-11]
MKKAFSIFCFLFFAAGLNAQVTYDYLKAADNYYNKSDYYSAAQYYEKYLAVNKEKIRQDSYDPYTVSSLSKQKKVAISNREQAVYKLAESYRKLHFYIKAEPYYKEAVTFDKAEFPLARFWHAQTLRALEHFAEAEKEFDAFLDVYKLNDIYSEEAGLEIMNLRFVQAQLNKKDLKLYSVTKANAILNTPGANYAPVWLNNTTLLFTSTRIDSTAKNTGRINKIYKAVYTDTAVSAITKVNLPQVKDVHQGVVAITPDNTIMFLTRWTISEDGHKRSAIYSSKNVNDTWSEPVLLDSTINATGYNAQQPFITPDGKYLLFASDKKGGVGGFDIWYAALDKNGKPYDVKNMGNVINTKGDEQAPYYHAPSGLLVFSSNGRVGMGGFDFFESKGKPGNWSEPKNMGYPVNSVKDDIYFTSKSNTKDILSNVLLSSDRYSECCLDLLMLRKQKVAKKVAGSVIACTDNMPVKGATVSIIDTINNKILFNETTAADGSYSFVVDEYLPVKAVASFDGYKDNFINIAVPADADEEAMNTDAICLTKPVVEKTETPPPVDAIIVLNNVIFDFNKSDLKPESFMTLDSVVAMLNKYPAMVVEIGAHTDSLGTDKYNLKLSERRAQSAVAYLTSKGIDVNRLQSKGYGASQPIAPNTKPTGEDDEEGRQKNRRVQLKIIHY